MAISTAEQTRAGDNFIARSTVSSAVLRLVSSRFPEPESAMAGVGQTTRPAIANGGMRTPTLLQKLSCASYIYFIPALLLLNVLCLCNKYTAIVWLG
jgi:hypothetical protein